VSSGTKQKIILLAMAGASIGWAWQTHSHARAASKPATITGQVIDIACFVGHNSSGEKHAKCAETCARAGNPLAIYDAGTSRIYLPISMDHKNPNEKLMPFIEKKVKVTGNLIEKAGLRGIALGKVEPAE
jgi:hypothetical protein